MNELSQKTIKSHYAKLVECINPLRVMDHLVNLLSQEEMELIRKAHLTPQDRTRELIAIILRKSEELRPFDCFIEALEKTDENHKTMAEAILITYKHENGANVDEKVSRDSHLDAGETEHGLKIAQQSLKEMYLTRFQEVRPFSLPFTFHIENTWVSLALKEDKKNSQATEDHAELLERAFKEAKLLIIEGDPATGKTSLMRRLAYEWANGKQELLHYDLVLYAEFREVREETFQSIADLVLYYSKKFLDVEGYKNFKKLIYNEKFCKESRILVLLDGYDESSLEKQCSELRLYINEKTINKALLFYIVITTRKGYLTTHRGVKGRLVFAEVLGFTTMTQKETYIFKHFLSQEIDDRENIAAVHSLLNKNKNLNKLAETPLFLTFICLVHERIIDGTLVELYCNIIRWLIDRHQQDFPDRDIPCSFGCHNGSSDKFETIQDHYLHFPQLRCLGKMALHKLKENVFKPTDCAQFNLQPVIEQVGLLRKERKHDNSFKLVTSFHFPHRTIQEFLAAFYCVCSKDPTSEWLLPNSKLDTATSYGGMNEFSRFLFRIALSNKMPVQAKKRKYYFDRMTDIKLDITFDAFHTTAGFYSSRLNRFFTESTNIQHIKIHGGVKNTSIHDGSASTSSGSNPKLLSFSGLMKLETLKFDGCTFSATSQLSLSGLIKLHSLTFVGCTFSTNSQLSFTNCSSLKELKFWQCKMESSTIVGLATLPAIQTVDFSWCNIDLATWQSLTNQISNSNVNYLQLSFGEDFNKEFLIHLQKCNNVERMDITISGYTIRQNDLLSFSYLIKLHSLTFGGADYGSACTFSASSQLSFTNCPSLKNLKFERCEMKSSTIIDITTLPAIETLPFNKCTFSANSQLSFTDCPSLKELRFRGCKMESSTIVGSATLPAIDTVQFDECTFSANSQLSLTNCPSLKELIFKWCEMKSSTIVGIATLPAIDTVQFDECTIDIGTWQSITDQISNSNVKYLQLSFGKYTVKDKQFDIGQRFQFGEDFNKEFLIHLQQCSNIDKMDITIWGYTIRQNDLLSFSHLINLHSLKFEGGLSSEGCIFSANSQLSFTDCLSLKELRFRGCKMESSTIVGIATLPAIDTVQFDECTFSANSQLSFTDCPSLKELRFRGCKMESSIIVGIATLPAIDTVQFDECTIDIGTWQSIIDQISNSNVKHLKLTFGKYAKKGSAFNKELLIHLQQCNNVEQMDITVYSYNIIQNDMLSFSHLIKLHSLTFGGHSSGCTFSANSELTFTNCPSLRELKFWQCEMESSTIVGIATLPKIDTVEFYQCSIDLTAWQSITDQINTSTVKCLKLTFGYDFNKEFLIHLQQCNNIEQMEITIERYTICQNDLLSFSYLIKLHSLTFFVCTFSANSQLSFTNCPSLKELKFQHCEMESSTIVGITTLPAIHTVQFDSCNIDLATWQSIIDQISNSNIKYLKMTFGTDFNKEFLIHLQQCNNVERMEFTTGLHTIGQNDLLSFSDLIKLHSLTFSECTFLANSQLSFTNCPSLKNLIFRYCEMRSSTIVGIATLPAIHTVEFDYCNIDLATWQSITDQISNSTVKYLHLSAAFFVKDTYPEYLQHLHKCERIQQIHVKDNVYLKSYESVTANLALTAQQLPALTTITISDQIGRRLDERWRLSERNLERIEKAGQQRNPHFSIKYVE